MTEILLKVALNTIVQKVSFFIDNFSEPHNQHRKLRPLAPEHIIAFWCLYLLRFWRFRDYNVFGVQALRYFKSTEPMKTPQHFFFHFNIFILLQIVIKYRYLIYDTCTKTSHWLFYFYLFFLLFFSAEVANLL
jgi:hypothetical protein